MSGSPLSGKAHQRKSSRRRDRIRFGEVWSTESNGLVLRLLSLGGFCSEKTIKHPGNCLVNTKKPVLPDQEEQAFVNSGGRVFRNPNNRIGSVSNDGASVSGDHNVNRVVAIGEGICQYLTTKQTGPAADQSGGSVATASRNACSDFISAAGAWIFDAPGHGDRGRLARLTAVNWWAATAQQTKAPGFSS